MLCVSSPAVIQDFSIDVWNGDFAYVDGNKTIHVMYPNCTVNGTFNVTYPTVNAQVFLSFTYVGLWFTNKNLAERGNYYTYRYWRSNFTFIKGEEFSYYNGTNIRLAHCVKPFDLFGIAEFFMVSMKSHMSSFMAGGVILIPWIMLRSPLLLQTTTPGV